MLVAPRRGVGLSVATSWQGCQISQLADSEDPGGDAYGIGGNRRHA
jgi:hypothetical protein